MRDFPFLIMDTLKEAIVLLNPEGKATFTNKAFLSLTGIPPSDVEGKKFINFITSPSENFENICEKVRNNPSLPFTTEFTFIGNERIGDTTITWIPGDGKQCTPCYSITISDITEKKRLTELTSKSQRLELLRQIAGDLAHDFGNMLTSINGFSRLIALKSTDEKIIRYATSIEKAGLKAHTLVKNLLTFSSNHATTVITFDVITILNEIFNMLAGILPNNIKTHTELPGIPLYLLGDPDKLHQCILNLCLNARDAIGEKNGTITLRATTIGNLIRIQVEDTGTGIPPEITDKIFDPFFSTKEKKAGTGLGLSVVYGIVTSYNGKISVDTLRDRGTTFTLELPLAAQ